MSTVRTRFAPSPTGFLHIGSLRTALYAYALAKHEKGDFLLRIEDTDQKREVEGATDALQKTLKIFGIKWDEIYIQSERHKSGIYKRAAEMLLTKGHAFYCQCSPKNAKEEGYSTELRDPCRDKKYTSGAIKLKVPENDTVSYFDVVHKKEISWNTNDVYDATLIKSDGFPTYHLAAMTDDIDMKVSHILRGHDWLPSTPIHLLVFKYLEATPPQIGHLTDILSATSGKKLSKRRDSVFCEQFLNDGILPQALINFVILLGWAPKDNRELFTLDEFVDNFSLDGLGDANPRFLDEKLLWFNGIYIRQKTDEELLKLLDPFIPVKDLDKDKLLKITALSKERIKKLSEFWPLVSFIFQEPENIDTNSFTSNSKAHISAATEALKDIDWQKDAVDNALLSVVKDNNFKTGDFFMDLRIAVSGRRITPPFNDSILLIEKQTVISRLNKLK